MPSESDSYTSSHKAGVVAMVIYVSSYFMEDVHIGLTQTRANLKTVII